MSAAKSLLERERRALCCIVAGVPLGDVLDDLLRAVEANGAGDTLSSILLVSEDGNHLRHGAAPRLPRAYCAAIDGIDIGEGVGSCGTAAYRNEAVYVADIASDPLWKDFRGLALGHGLRACWSTPIRAADGRPLGTFAIYYPEPRAPTQADLDAIEMVAQTAALAIERSIQDRALRRSEASLRRLTEALEIEVAARTQERDRLWALSHDPFVVADLEGRWLSVSPAWTALLGWQAHELVGRSSEWMEHPDDRAGTRAQIESLGRGQRTVRFDNRFRARDGSYRWFSWTAVPEGEFMYCVARDVTDEHERQAELERAQAELRQAQKMEAIGKLTGGVAHDFNNLLQVVSGNLQLLADDVADHPRATRRVQNAMAGVSRGAKLAAQLLAFSRRQALEPKVINVGGFLRGLDDMLRHAVGEEIQVQTLIQDGLWNTLADPGQLENSLLNLAINARDAMDGRGQLTIEVGNRRLEHAPATSNADIVPGQYVMVAVADTGCGIPVEIVEEVFEPFFSTKPRGKGTGLGLSMVYGFVKQSGGHVTIDSAVGLGTRIAIYLPRAHQQADALVPADRSPVVGGSETILLVEDDSEVRITATEMLRGLGYRVLHASDAASAMGMIERGEPIDLLFSDVLMPGPLRSTELARIAVKRLPGLKVLFTSGYPQNAIVHDGRLDKGVNLLAKPYTREVLARKLRHTLTPCSQRGDLESSAATG